MEELEPEVGKGELQWQLSPEAGEASGNPRLRVTVRVFEPPGLTSGVCLVEFHS